jgi:signal transduction histidine kinase/DNA-binding NarL/FixJ family response regulator/HPt (histidine-containing phosphotransfer) domain-containing protein
MIWLAVSLAILTGVAAILAVAVVGLRRAVAMLEARAAEETVKRAQADAELTARTGLEGSLLLWMRHEIRTPINAVVGMADLLLDLELTSKQREYLGMLRASAEGLSRTVNEVLDLCRLETGRLVLDRQPFDLRGEVDVSLDRVASMAAERGIDLSYRIEGPAPSTLLGDAARLRHVLATLLTYAVRRTHEGGVTLSVSTRPMPPDRHEVSFVVRDTGMVISPERAARLFQPLSRIIASDRVADAQDLGLTLCHGIARMMGGHIALRNEVRDGSTFEFVMTAENPARMLQTRLPAPRIEPVVPEASHPLRILLAEDSVVAQKVAVDVLERLGHSVHLVGDGEAVLRALEAGRYDVILMDMHMPGMDGLTATRRVCERWPRDRRPRIIALSASDLPEDRARWLGAGADGWVSKSLPADEVRHVLSSLVVPAGVVPPRASPIGSGESRRPPQYGAAPGAAVHIIEIFLQDAAVQLSALRGAVERHDAAAVERVAHTMKGSAAMLGASSVARICAELIHNARQGSFNGGAAIVSQLDDEVAAIQRSLSPRLAHVTQPSVSGQSE